MDFSQPSDGIVTKKTEAENEKLNQIRNNVSILEAELKRLRGLIEAEKYAVEQLVLQKKELEDSIPKLSTQYAAIAEDIAGCTSSLEALKEQKLEAEREVAESKVIASENKLLYTDLLDNLAREQVIQDEERAILNERAERIAENEAVLQAKITQLKSIIL